MNEVFQYSGHLRALLIGIGLSICLCASDIAIARATIVSLPSLVAESELIVYGTVARTHKEHSSESDEWVRFKVVGALKGDNLVQSGTVMLCNFRPNTEYPDLSKLNGDAVLFLMKSPSKNCFNLSHNYRSVIGVHDEMADTLDIDGQPERQPFEQFKVQVAALVSAK